MVCSRPVASRSLFAQMPPFSVNYVHFAYLRAPRDVKKKTGGCIERPGDGDLNRRLRVDYQYDGRTGEGSATARLHGLHPVRWGMGGDPP